MKNGRRPPKKMENNLNFKAVLSLMETHIKTIIDRVTAWADLTTKTSKTNGFDTIEIDLVLLLVTEGK